MSQIQGKSVEAGVRYLISTNSLFSKKRCSGSVKLAGFYINYLGITQMEELFNCPKDFEPETVLREFRYQLNPKLKNYDREKEYREKYSQDF
tara:strand:+ start:287 stop:562 length:276 start_codon:yes stop_codon:yes gene_type:complete